MLNKTCGRCKVSKDITLFAKKKSSKDGLGLCKECKLSYKREWSKNNRDKVNSVNKKSREKKL